MDSARFAYRFPVAKLVLTIPHSNAGEECVFLSFVKSGVMTGKLHSEATLSPSITVKLNLPESKAQPCYLFQPSKHLTILHQSIRN